MNKNSNHLFSCQQTVQYSLLIADVLDAYLHRDPKVLLPAPLANSQLNQHWQIIGNLVANDTVGKLDPDDWQFYGVLVQHKLTDNYLVILRGTVNIEEWINDFKCELTNHYSTGQVEKGFYSIYQTLRYLPFHSQNIMPTNEELLQSVDASTAIKSVVGDKPLTITGHSLGAALATYLTFDLATEKQNVKMCLFASPHPGDRQFTDKFEMVMRGQYFVCNYLLDIVPTIPPALLGYHHLQNIALLLPKQAKAKIKPTLSCNHHIICYSAMLDYQSVNDWRNLLIRDDDNTHCILSENKEAATQNTISLNRTQ